MPPGSTRGLPTLFDRGVLVYVPDFSGSPTGHDLQEQACHAQERYSQQDSRHEQDYFQIVVGGTPGGTVLLGKRRVDRGRGKLKHIALSGYLERAVDQGHDLRTTVCCEVLRAAGCGEPRGGDLMVLSSVVIVCDIIRCFETDCMCY